MSSAPATVTVCATFQFSGVKNSIVVGSDVSVPDADTVTCTSAVGRDCSATDSGTNAPHSPVASPCVRSTCRPATSSSTWVSTTDCGGTIR